MYSFVMGVVCRMSIQEKMAKLDAYIKDYLCRMSGNREEAGLLNGDFLTVLRDSVDCGFAFWLQRDISTGNFSFAEYSSAMEGLELAGIEFPISREDAAALVKHLGQEEVVTDQLSFLGEDFASPMAYYGVIVDDKLTSLVGVCDFDKDQREWSADEKKAVAGAGRALGLYAEYKYLHDVKVIQVEKLDAQVKNEKEQRNKLEKALSQAENANKAKQKFLSNMSHDIRTPMNAIIGFATLANTHIQEHDRVRDYLNKITASSKHLLSLFNDVLDMTSIEEGRAHLDEKPHSLPDIIRDVRKMVCGIIEAKQIKFTMETVDVIHEHIFCDGLRFNQVMLNLISNSIKYITNDGVITVIITEKGVDERGYVTFEFKVTDNGVGMSPSFVEHIFEPFEREKSSAKHVVQGSGLGMAITKNIVDMMGGTISISSQQGVGTEITVTLDFKLQSEHYGPETSDAMLELEGKRVLVVNSSSETCSGLVSILDGFGASSEWTMSANEALLRAKMACQKNEGYSAFYIDWHMPDMNGVEIVRQLHKLVSEDVPMILVVDDDYKDVEDDAQEAGVAGFLTKPIFASDVRALIKSTMSSSASGDEAHSIVQEDEFVGRRILLAEDNKMNQEIAVTILEDAGFFVDLAEDGEVAVDKVINHSEGHYDLILMDIKMPVMDGYEATRRIRAMTDPGKRDIPIIAMTADAFFEDRQLALQCGMNEHITKPVDIDRLFSILKSVIK